MVTNGVQQNTQQPTEGITGLFQTKAQQTNVILGTIGKSLGNPSPLGVNQKNGRREQVFANGEIAEKVDNAQNLADLAISYKPFSEFIARNGYHWLGDPIEDFYSAKNGAGRSIVVQRYDNGVVWWDGQSEPCCLGWHDWHVIAWPGSNGKGVPNQGAFNTFWKDMTDGILLLFKIGLYAILGIVALVVLGIIIYFCTR